MDIFSGKLPGMIETSYFKLERDLDGDIICHPLGSSMLDTFSWQVYDCILPEAWEDKILSMKPGYYKVTYNIFKEEERGEFGEIIASYNMLDELLFIKTAPIYGRWLVFQTHLRNTSFFGKSLFLKTWRVEFEYGNFGYYSGRMYLPKALYIWAKNNILKLFSDDKTHYGITRH